MGVISRGIRNAFRNNVRTLSIVLILGLSIGLTLVMVLAHQAVGKKISDVKANIGNSIYIQPTGYNPLSSANNALTIDQVNPVKSISHITGVTETLSDRLTTIGSSTPFGSQANSNNQTSLTSPVTFNNDNGGGRFFISGGGGLPANFSPPIRILGTTDPEVLNSQTGSTAALKSGQFIDGTKDSSQAMISTDMASKNNLSVGSTFTAYGSVLTVAGIFDSGTQGGNDVVVVSLPTLQRLSGQGNVISEAVAVVDSADNLSSTTTAVKNKLGADADVTSSLDAANNTTQPLKNVQNISLISLIGAMIAGIIIILLTMVMIVRERRREIGILKAIGASNLRVIFQFMSEALTLTILAAVIGLVIGVAGGNPVTNTLVSNSANSSTVENGNQRTLGASGTISFQRPTGGFVNRTGGNVRNTLRNIHASVGWSLLAWGLGVAILVAVAGAALAGWLVAKVRPAEVMRAE